MLEDSLTAIEGTRGANTIREILSEPDTWAQCLAALEESGQLSRLNKSLPKGVEWIFTGCGSSFYLAQVAAATWMILTGENARAIPASEILLFPGTLPRPCQPVLISRSGHTSEVVEVAKYLEYQLAIPTLAITCGAETPIEGIAAYAIRLAQADEKSTVMTRSFTSMLLALQALAAKRVGRSDFSMALRALPNQFQRRLEEIHAVVRSLAGGGDFADYVFLGQGPFFGVAQESMLKVKEMSCSYAQCFHTLEFRHGPKAIVGPETLVTFFLSESGFDAEVAVLEEIKELRGTTLAITNSANSAVRKHADYLIELSLDVPELLRAVAAIVPGQLLGFHTGIRKGYDPDQPRHLTRVVMLDADDAGGSTRGGG
jgi:glutamine---fructose-6-phosphate transaminase (isomerizing)